MFSITETSKNTQYIFMRRVCHSGGTESPHGQTGYRFPIALGEELVRSIGEMWNMVHFGFTYCNNLVPVTSIFSIVFLISGLFDSKIPYRLTNSKINFPKAISERKNQNQWVWNLIKSLEQGKWRVCRCWWTHFVTEWIHFQVARGRWYTAK